MIPPGVLVVTDAYPPRCGGSGWSTHALVLALMAAGHRVEVVETSAHASDDDEREVDGVRVRRLGLGRHRTPRARIGRSDFSFRPVRDHVARLLAERAWVDIVHGQHLHSGPGAVAAAVAHGRGSVITLRDLWPIRIDGLGWPDEPIDAPPSRPRTAAALRDTFGVPRPVAGFLVGWARRRLRWRATALAQAGRVIAVSDSVRRRIRRQVAGVEPAVVPSVVDAARTHALADAGRGRAAVPGSPYLLAAGKLNRAKGFDTLVDRLADAGLDATLVVAGSGPLETHLRERARARAIRLDARGWLDAPELLALTAGADALLLPSACEDSLSRLVVEALALGTPVVGTATGGTPEAVSDGVNGWLVREPADWRRALRALADGRPAASRAASRSAERYAPELVIPQIHQVYREAMAEVGRG